MINKREHYLAHSGLGNEPDRPSMVHSPFYIAAFKIAFLEVLTAYPSVQIMVHYDCHMHWLDCPSLRLCRLQKGFGDDGQNRLWMLGDICTAGMRHLAGANIVYRALAIFGDRKISYWFCMEEDGD